MTASLQQRDIRRLVFHFRFYEDAQLESRKEADLSDRIFLQSLDQDTPGVLTEEESDNDGENA